MVHKPKRATKPHGGIIENSSGRGVLAEGSRTSGAVRAEDCLEAAEP